MILMYYDKFYKNKDTNIIFTSNKGAVETINIV